MRTLIGRGSEISVTRSNSPCAIARSRSSCAIVLVYASYSRTLLRVNA